MKKSIYVALLLLLSACQSTPNLEDDVRYVKWAKVVDVHVYNEAERKEAKAQRPSDTKLSIGMGVGFGMGSGGFGGVMLGSGVPLGSNNHDSKEPPQIAFGANRYTLEIKGSLEHFEVLSYGKYKPGDCVKVLMGHPTEFARIFDLKKGETCD